MASIGDFAFADCSNLTNITIGKGVTSIGDYAFYGCSGLESISVFDENTKYCSKENCLIETETKTLILGCNNSIVPNDNSVTSIGDYAFYGCSGLTGELIIPDSVTSIGDSAFHGCGGLTSVTIGKGVTSIGYGMFNDCSGLTNVTIGENVSNIGYHAFYGCTSLENVEFKDTTTWFKASTYTDMENRKGELVDVSNSANNAKIISDCYWYKI